MISKVNIRATALQEFWSNEYPDSIYLWQGAKHDLPLSEIENNPVPTYEDIFYTQEQIQTGHDYCKAFSDRILPVLAAKLNKIHGLNLTDSFWRICFGQWLYRHVVSAYEKYEILKRIDLDNVAIKLLDKGSFFIPKDHYEYLLCFANDFGAQQLVSQYFYLYSQKQFPNIKKPPAYKPIDFCNLAETEGNACHDIALMGVFLSGEAYNLLHSRSDGKIGNLGLPKDFILNDIVNFDARNIFIEDTRDNNFESYFFNTLYYCLPKDFVENFKAYYNSFGKDLQSKKFRYLVVEAWISHIPSAIYAALAKVNKRTVICYEHGSGSAFYPNFPGRFVDTEAGDYFVSVGWGKTQGNFVKGGFAVRDIKPYQFAPENQAILYISRTKAPYQFELNEATICNGTFIRELRLASDFIDQLPAALRNTFVFRPRGKDVFFWDTEATLELGKRRLILDRSPDFSGSILRSKVVVIDHISTGVAELLMMDAPFIILHAVSRIGCNDELKSIFDDLRLCGVIHETPQSAILHLMAIHNDVAYWWKNARVSAAIQRMRNFSLAPASAFTDYVFSLLNKD